MAKSVDIISSQWIRPIEKVTVTDAVLSVYDKSGITELGSFLASKGVTLMSTGGTRKILLEKAKTQNLTVLDTFIFLNKILKITNINNWSADLMN